MKSIKVSKTNGRSQFESWQTVSSTFLFDLLQIMRGIYKDNVGNIWFISTTLSRKAALHVMEKRNQPTNQPIKHKKNIQTAKILYFVSSLMKKLRTPESTENVPKFVTRELLDNLLGINYISLCQLLQILHVSGSSNFSSPTVILS